MPVAAVLVPEQRQKRKDEEDATRTAERRADAHQPRQPEHIAPPEIERADGEEEKQRLRVDRGEEERRREECQRPDGTSCGVRIAVVEADQPVHDQQRAEKRHHKTDGDFRAA